MDFAQIITQLRKYTACLSELRKECSKFVQYFQMMSNIIDIPLNDSVDKLVTMGEKLDLDRYIFHLLKGNGLVHLITTI